MPPAVNPVGAPPVASQASTPLAAGVPVWSLVNNEWQSGKLVQFDPPSSRRTAVVALDDGTFAPVDMENLRHGDKPAMTPRLATNFINGKKPHTLKLYQGKWMLARPDGRVLKEYDDDEVGQRDANAHFDRLEPELAKLRVAQTEADASPAPVVPLKVNPSAPVRPSNPV